VGRRLPGHGRPVGPAPVQPGGPPLLFGGTGRAAVRRTVSMGAGWIAGGGGAATFEQGAGQVRAAWDEAGRPGAPRLAALGYFALGPDASTAASDYLHDYYGFLGDYAAQVVAGALTEEDAVRQAIAQFTDAGCDELILFPCSTAADQLSRLADVARSSARSRVARRPDRDVHPRSVPHRAPTAGRFAEVDTSPVPQDQSWTGVDVGVRSISGAVRLRRG